MVSCGVQCGGDCFKPVVKEIVDVTLPYVVCALYIGSSVAIGISTAVRYHRHVQETYRGPTIYLLNGNAHGNSFDYAFNPVCVVLLTEVVKFCISVLIYTTMIVLLRQGPAWAVKYCIDVLKSNEGKSFIPAELSFSDAKWLALPAILFTANNILLFQAIGKNDTSAFGVFGDTMILWTAAMWRGVFTVEFGWTRLAGIFTVFLGLVVSNVFSSKSTGDFSWMFMWVLLMTLCNAAGSVANEYALKRNKALDLNVQNMVLYGFCAAFSYAYLCCADPPRARMHGTFFSGFDSHTWLTIRQQSLVGLLVPYLLKHGDSVMATIATCLSGPVAVMVMPMFTHMWHWHIGGSAASWLSAFIVAIGSLAYLAEGPMPVPHIHRGKE